MKAVILAGGEGSRLRPLTLGRPKPMTLLLGKPVLGHILDLLRRHGVTEVAVTLRCLPAAITDHFGDGADWGVSLHYFLEAQPLGTAGSVKQCMDFLGDEDFLVVSGDAVCDLDLSALAAYHRSRRAVATLALCRRAEPLEYGLVRTDAQGRVLGFVEKPGWGQVDTELVNTGVYVLSPAAMAQVPENAPYDFGRDLFPRLLEHRRPLYGWEGAGYWQDMGDCGAYLAANLDALEGKVALDQITGAGPLPQGIELRPPCWIAPGVTLARGCVIGPGAVLHAGTSVATGAVVERSVLLGAHVGEGAEVSGAILCQNVHIHPRAVVGDSAVLGEGAVVGADAIVAPGVKLWPGCRVDDGGKATVSRTAAHCPQSLRFSSSAILEGAVGEALTPQSMLTLGSALAEEGTVGLGWTGGNAGAMLARALGCGVAAAGSDVVVSDAPCASAGAWLGRYHQLDVTAFLTQDGDSAQLRLFDSGGLPLERPRLRQLESALARGDLRRAGGSRVGKFETVAGVSAGYAAQAAALTRLSPRSPFSLTVQAERGSGPNELLAAALSATGCTVRRGSGRGAATFSADWGGSRLTAWDETGALLSPDTVLVLLTHIEMEHGARRCVLPPWAPAAADWVAESFGGALLRLGRDGEEARQLWREQPWMWDAVFAACRICHCLALTGQSLSRLTQSLPPFATVRGEVPLGSGRGRVMERALSGADAQRLGQGSRIRAGDGWVYVTPLSRRGALRVIAEATSMEAARELYAQYTAHLKALDEAP